ncbi:MAG: hypothetical protein HY706_03040 [Candidatus Hydrogenedentes bacterium]|nr:hypothetical protein [Candidatus Hydrogenedentota bacterium]
MHKYWEQLSFSRLAVRAKVLFTLLAVMLAMQAYSYLQVGALESELSELADEKAREMKVYYSQVQVPDVTTDVTASQRYVLFGEAVGKVTVFLRLRDRANRPSYRGIDYFYVRSEGNWHLTESGFCGDREVQARAHAAFSRVG